MKTTSAAAANDLRRDFDGLVILPGDAEYDLARRVWNVDVVREPAMVARPATAMGVQQAVRFARRHDLPIAVRGGGHGLAGYGTADDALVVDLRGLSSVHVDATERIATVGAGLTWGVLDGATQEHGLAVTGADAPMVGVGGVTVGGGLGWLHRLAGLTCDNLHSCDVVTADGELLEASPRRHPDLYWALRGGGGNFGVVTRFQFRLRPVRELMAGTLVYPLDRAPEVLGFYQEQCEDAPVETALRLTLMKAPPAPFIPSELHGEPVLLLGAVAYGPPATAASLLRAIRDFGSPAADTIRPVSYLELQQPPGRFPERQRAYGYSAFLGRLDDTLIDAFVDAATELPSPLAMIQVQQLGGAITSVADDDTAFPHRRATHHLAVNALAAQDDVASELTAWTKATASAVQPHVRGGPYVSFVTGEESRSEIRQAYGPAVHDRLVEIKSAYDPENVFRFNANVPPALPKSP
ncbi:FAD-binding oxidoreductase [Nonomuraea sp. NPDC003804]|uniref:FAD-binding oxidoreductase n=1 Tax=Nonomuraea sp. NPDC003804 TaxID=3154547 RepID=UPI0033B1814E